MEELKQYVGIVKKNYETMNAPDYEGKEVDLANQKEDLLIYEEYLKENSTSLESFDKIVSATVDYVSNEISYSELEGIYNRLTK
jgi:Uncharacterized YnfE-like